MFILLICAIGWKLVTSLTFEERLDKARMLIRRELHDIKKHWDIDHYPNFLFSPALSKSAWELMKLKLQDRILAADNSTTTEVQSWIVSFMGSSVTTGRDSPVGVGFVELIQKKMYPIFQVLNINFNATNNAMENNPCVPYDLCVAAFAGEDADMIHWEQSYNCEGTREVYEQFVRQSLLLKNKPIVVFSHSATENWREDKCKVMPRPHVVTDTERTALKMFHHHRPIELFTSMNQIKTHFSVVEQINKQYVSAGIQVFWHQDHAEYKCQGPYIPDWGCCSAPWHPSLKGHELRAAHHSLLWLLILHDAVSELHHRLVKISTVNTGGILENLSTALRGNVSQHLANFYAEPMKSPIYQSEFVDGIQCLTDLEPRNNRAISLRASVVTTQLTRNAENTTSWNEHVYFKGYYSSGGLANDLKEGRLDQVICLVGNKESGAIHFALTAKQVGKLFICHATGNWGNQPKDFTTYEKDGPEVYISVTSATSDFVFHEDTAKKVLFKRTRGHGENCITLDGDIQPGPFVLTVVPKSTKRITIATILVP